MQANVALRCIEFCGAKNVLIVYGTPYHVGRGEDWEQVLFERCRDTLPLEVARIGANEDLVVNGLVINVKHKVGASQIPHGRFTAPAKERLWNMLWAERGQRPKAHVIIRGHVHYHGHCGDSTFLALTCPALQGLGSKYVSRECSGIVDLGLIHFDIQSAQRYSWEANIMELSEVAATPMVV